MIPDTLLCLEGPSVEVSIGIPKMLVESVIGPYQRNLSLIASGSISNFIIYFHSMFSTCPLPLILGRVGRDQIFCQRPRNRKEDLIYRTDKY